MKQCKIDYTTAHLGEKSRLVSAAYLHDGDVAQIKKSLAKMLNFFPVIIALETGIYTLRGEYFCARQDTKLLFNTIPAGTNITVTI